MADIKIDPIRDHYFGPLERAEQVDTWLFYLSASLSLITPLIDQVQYPTWYNVTQRIFILVVLALFAVGQVIRLYFSPRAQERRYQDFLSHAFGVPLSHEQTQGYYNSNGSDVSRRFATQLLENSFYSKDTASQMTKWARVKFALYICLWIVLLMNHHVDLAAIGIIAQIIFSEQLLSRYLRIEWQRYQFERTYDDLFRLFQSGAKMDVVALELVGRYEMAKATAGITLSSRIFSKRQESTDKEWAEIRRVLGI